MEVKTILVYHPNGRDSIKINETDFVQGTHRLFNAPAEKTPEAPKAPAVKGNDLKAKLMEFDPNLATEEGVLAVADEATYDNKKTCALADLLGIEYKQQTKRDDIRKQNFEALAKLFKK